MIRAFYGRWEEMLGGAIEETVEILKELKARHDPIYALTNWSHETFPIALERFDFLHWFNGTLVSGAEKLAKPDLAIFQLLLGRYDLKADECLFIDDSAVNISAADTLGFDTHHFVTAQGLRDKLIMDKYL